MSSYKAGYKAKGGLQSPKYAEKKRKQKMAILVLSLLGLLILLVGAVLFLRSSILEVKTIVVKGPADLKVLDIENKVHEVLGKDVGQSAYFIFPKTGIFFISKSKLEKAVVDAFPEVNTVSVSRSGLNQLTLTIQERIPVAIVCFGLLEDNSTTADGNNKALNCYYSDRHGFIFASISSSTPLSSFTHIASGANLPSFDTLDSYSYYYVPTDKGTSPLGTTFIDEKRFEALEDFVNGAHSGGLSALGVLVGDNGEYEMYVKNKKEDSEATVYFDDKVPFKTTLSNLLTFWDNPISIKAVQKTPDKNTPKAPSKTPTPALATTTPATGAFDYINLRFGNTVYYSTH